MPELPEVETVCRGLAKRLEGRSLARVTARRGDLRRPLPPDFAARLTGRRVAGVARRGKYILVRLDDAQVLIVHLGMSGRVRVHGDGGPAPPLGPHDHVVFETCDGATLVFHDARRFGVMDLARADELAAHPLLAALGPEPLAESFTGPALAATLRGKATSIKSALMDQRVVAGLGNIYVCESLFRAGLSPLRRAGTVVGRRAERLAGAIRETLAEAVSAGGSSLRDHMQPTGELGYFQHRFAVYGREGLPCPGCACGGVVRRIVQSGRSTFYCARRQR